MPVAPLPDKHDADILIGARRIADFLFGDDDRSAERRVYYLNEAGDDPPPIFKIGRLKAARKSSLLEWITRLEAKAMAGK